MPTVLHVTFRASEEREPGKGSPRGVSDSCVSAASLQRGQPNHRAGSLQVCVLSATIERQLSEVGEDSGHLLGLENVSGGAAGDNKACLLFISLVSVLSMCLPLGRNPVGSSAESQSLVQRRDFSSRRSLMSCYGLGHNGKKNSRAWRGLGGLKFFPEYWGLF